MSIYLFVECKVNFVGSVHRFDRRYILRWSSCEDTLIVTSMYGAVQAYHSQCHVRSPAAVACTSEYPVLWSFCASLPSPCLLGRCPGLGCKGSALAHVLGLLLKCRIIGLLLCVVKRVRGSILLLLLLLLLLSLVVGYADLFRWARRPGLARLFSFSGLAGHLAFGEVTM
jgi:hypothetical protein